MFYRSYSSGAVILLIHLIRTCGGAPIVTCGQQLNCLKAALTPNVNEISCGPCTYKLCLEIDYRAGCTKSTVETSGQTISHVCKKDESQCASDNTGFSGSTRINEGIYDNGAEDVFSMCQYGAGGETLNFLMKDGGGDCVALTAAATVSGLEGTGMNAACDSLFNTELSGCGGGTNVHKTECVWSFTLPSCGTGGTITEVNGGPPPVVIGGTECNSIPNNNFQQTIETNAPVCGFQEVKDLLQAYDCIQPLPGCNELQCQRDLPPETVAALQACA